MMVMYERQWQHLYGNKWAKYAKGFLRRNPLCVYCLQIGKTKAADLVDHIVPHRGNIELFNDPKNHQSLCATCHDSVKRREEARGYAVGCDENGLPVDTNHPWRK